MLIVGLTGGIGSGKTTVAALFAAKGITVIDTDQLAREVIQPLTPAFKQVIQYFGADALQPNGELNRGKLRQIIFEHPEKKQWLEQLLHPLIRSRMQTYIEQAQSPYCIVIIPLLFETAPHSLITRVLVVDATEETQAKRAHMRDQVSQDAIKTIMQTQVSRSKRLAKADDVIYNDGLLEDLQPQVDRLHAFYLAFKM